MAKKLKKTKKKIFTIKPMSLIRFNFKSMPVDFHNKYPFKEDDNFVFLGEIVQMPGHCVIAHTKTGQVHVGYHTDNFVVLTEDEC